MFSTEHKVQNKTECPCRGGPQCERSRSKSAPAAIRGVPLRGSAGGDREQGSLLIGILGRVTSFVDNSGVDIWVTSLATESTDATGSLPARKVAAVAGRREWRGPPRPFDDESFDIVATFKTLHHVPQWEAAVAEMVRVLKPGGRLVYADLVVPRWLAVVGRRVAGRHAGFITRDALRCLIEAQGLAIVRQRPLGPAFELVAIRPAGFRQCTIRGGRTCRACRGCRSTSSRCTVRTIQARGGARSGDRPRHGGWPA